MRRIGALFTVGLGRPAASSFLLSSAEELGQKGLSSIILWGGEEEMERGKGGRGKRLMQIHSISVPPSLLLNGIYDATGLVLHKFVGRFAAATTVLPQSTTASVLVPPTSTPISYEDILIARHIHHNHNVRDRLVPPAVSHTYCVFTQRAHARRG